MMRIINGMPPHRLRVRLNQSADRPLIIRTRIIRMDFVFRPFFLQLADQFLHRSNRPLLSEAFPQQSPTIRFVKYRKIRKPVGMTLCFRLDDIITESMKGPHNHPFPCFAGISADPLPHLPTGLIGKSQAQDFLRKGAVLLDDVDNAAGQCIRLPRSSRSQQQNIPVQFLDRFPLQRIEV